MVIHQTLSRVYQFSAAHRLNAPMFSDQKNIEIYDKCNNPFGHGHNYIVEVTVKGKAHKDTGMIISLEQLDREVGLLLKTIDYKHLDNEVSFFKNRVSTGENIIQFIWQELNKRIKGRRLYHIKLWETNNNIFEIGKEN